MILKLWVMEPVVVNTVSNFIESSLSRKSASALVIKASFLHEEKQIKNNTTNENNIRIITNLQ